ECFMAVNCAALTETLLESELFGYEKGAFTGADRQRIGKFEQCNGGTIFLDEVGDMSQLTQGKVLRLLQEQKFERVGGNKTIETDVRIIAATNRNLEQMVKEGTFREDLFYRLNGMTISLPPLRERGNDIALLVEHYLNEACYEMGRTEVEGISSEALDQLLQYRWPGNVRELQSVVRQSLLNSTSPVIVPSSLPDDVSSQFKSTPQVFQSEDPLDEDPALPLSDLQLFVDQRLAAQTKDLYSETLETMERYLLTRVLNETGGNQTRAAEILGITRGKIRDRIAQFGISLEKTVSIDENGS
ncbi:MAG: sigma 54-interacting transcriptional regulator, partial [Gimesia chilikensis]